MTDGMQQFLLLRPGIVSSTSIHVHRNVRPPVTCSLTCIDLHRHVSMGQVLLQSYVL
jgi:hypothetical protein